jgi:hypothetical protein
VLAFVVSADGPVTVFSDGHRIADLKAGGVRKTLESITASRRPKPRSRRSAHER